MATTTVGVATVVNSGKRDAGHLDTLATGMDFEDRFTKSNEQRLMTRFNTGRHSSNPHFRRCGVGYVTDIGERSWLALPGCRQSVFRAELLA
eukprot:5083422-Amphidinium_carterae.1